MKRIAYKMRIVIIFILENNSYSHMILLLKQQERKLNLC